MIDFPVSVTSTSNLVIHETNSNQQQLSSSTSSILNFRQSQGQQSSSSSLMPHNTFRNIGNGLGRGSNGPPTLDLNEFPSLGASASINAISQSSNIGRLAYVGMVKDNIANQSGSNEFNIQSEDFPALPGVSPGSAAVSLQLQNNTGPSSTQDGNTSNNGGNQDHHHFHHHSNDNNHSANTMAGLTIPKLFSSLSSAHILNDGDDGKEPMMHATKEGHATNLPPGMLNDQYGIAGLLALIQQANSNPNLFALTVGYDVSNINMNLNSKDRLYHTFPGPWNDKPLKPYEIDYPVPQEYLVFNSIRDQLSEIKLSNFCEDLLFFLFYCFAGEHMQAAVGAELYSRDWRFHKDEGIWITRKQGNPPMEQNNNFERGSYIYFDTNTWSKLQKEMLIKYDRLDGPNPS